MTEMCQQIDCPDDAEFEMIDNADDNYETQVTHACVTHVGEMLTHALHVPEDAANEWSVRSL